MSAYYKCDCLFYASGKPAMICGIHEKLHTEIKQLTATVHAAGLLRDHCINNAGTPPAVLVCNLDDAINESKEETICPT